MIPRAEHPNPQFERANWLNLNGTWQFELDNGRSGRDRKLYEPDKSLSGEITVPFCPQSKLSGVEQLDFMYGMWYKRQVTLTEKQTSGRVLLHFGAVDYRCIAYVNGQKAGEHKGGYVSFAFDVSGLVCAGNNQITVYAEDDERDPMIPSGKQSRGFYSGGCDYTRTSGIWQTVWLEFMPDTYIDSVKYYPNVRQGVLTMQCQLHGAATLIAEAFYDEKPMGKITVQAESGLEYITLPLTEKHLWQVGVGGLYDLRLTYGDDVVKSYFGLRGIRMDGMKFMLNDKSVFQRLVLDQGFYPDGIYTAPTDAALLHDIEMSQAMGFNGARLHQKIFEPRFLYHCDRLGYLVWGEYPNWGQDYTRAESVYGILPEWTEEILRDFNHPSIIGWCPYNETLGVDGRKQNDDTILMVYETTKALDPTRPCIDSSGFMHVKTDIFDVHDYEQAPDALRAHYAPLVTEGKLFDNYNDAKLYQGEPTFVSEYGGIKWSKADGGWGYGNAPKTPEEFIERFRGLSDALLDNEKMFGFCYTQLTDIEQEQNGLYTYDREPKFPPETIYEILTRKAAIED